jgi:hypothetical protein
MEAAKIASQFYEGLAHRVNLADGSVGRWPSSPSLMLAHVPNIQLKLVAVSRFPARIHHHPKMGKFVAAVITPGRPVLERLPIRQSTPRLRVASYDELNAWLLDRCVAYAKAHKHPELTDRTIWQAFEAERPKLVPITDPFDGFHAAQASVSNRRLVSDDRYSSLARLRAAGIWGSGYWGVPKIRALFEATYFVGLRKAGMPEE